MLESFGILRVTQELSSHGDGILHSVKRPVIDQGPVIDQLVVIGYKFLKDT